MRRISNDHIKSTTLHNPIKLNKPVEGLMILEPLFVFLLVLLFAWNVVAIDAILHSKIGIEFGAQGIELIADLLFVFGRGGALEFDLVGGLYGTKMFHGSFEFFGLLLNTLQDLISCSLHIEIFSNSVADLIQAGEAYQRISSKHIEVNVGQWLDVIWFFDLCDQLEEEAQFTDFDSFFHDVDAVEVVDNDRFEDEIFTAMVSGNLLENISEAFDVIIFLAFVGLNGLVELVTFIDKVLHTSQTGLVEWFEDI